MAKFDKQSISKNIHFFMHMLITSVLYVHVGAGGGGGTPI